MDFINGFYDWVFGAAGANMMIVFLVLADILLFVFFAGIVISIAYSYGAKYRSTGKSVINAINYELEPDEIQEYIEQLPYAALSAWQNYLKLKKGKPSDFMSATICVDNPMKVAWLKVFSKFLYQLAAACAVFFVGYDMGAKTGRMAAVLFVAGIVLGLILMISDKINYNATLIMHEKLTVTIDMFAEKVLPKTVQQPAADPAQVAYPYPYPPMGGYAQAPMYQPVIYPGAAVPYPHPLGTGMQHVEVHAPAEGAAVSYNPNYGGRQIPPERQAINTVARPPQPVNVPKVPLKETIIPRAPDSPARHRPRVIVPANQQQRPPAGAPVAARPATSRERAGLPSAVLPATPRERAGLPTVVLPANRPVQRPSAPQNTAAPGVPVRPGTAVRKPGLPPSSATQTGVPVRPANAPVKQQPPVSRPAGGAVRPVDRAAREGQRPVPVKPPAKDSDK